MDAAGSPVPECINPHNFPAKLWRLVNNPAYKAIHWDSKGETIIIDQQLFERQILSPGAVTLDNADAFKTTNFSSFVRQLNLYGFRKVDPVTTDKRRPGGDTGRYHYFTNPNFTRDRPELLASLRRLTVSNKAKLQAGLEVTCQPPCRHQRLSGGGEGRDKNVKRGCSSLHSPTHQESNHPCFLNKAKAMTAYSGTPVPPRYVMMRERRPVLSPTVFAAGKAIPISVRHHYAGVAPNSNAVHIQQGLLAHADHANPNFPIFSPRNAQCQPGFCTPVFQCYQPNFVASHLTGSGLPTGPFSPQTYYQEHPTYSSSLFEDTEKPARYPLNIFCHGDCNNHPQEKEHQEVKKCGENLNTVFQIADEMMETSPSSCLIRIVSPAKLSNSGNTVLSDSPASTMQANPLSTTPRITAVIGRADLETYRQQEDSVLPVPEQMPDDAICEVTSDDAEDTEIEDVKFSDTLQVTSQAYNRSCTGSAPNA